MIDAEARDGIARHRAMRAKGRPVFQQARQAAGATGQGTFIAPTLIEIAHRRARARDLRPGAAWCATGAASSRALIEQINGTGYGLTFGVHTRIDETIARVVDSVHAGNLYVNRNMVGAVVGVQPFGGEACPAPAPRRAVRSTCTGCWPFSRQTRWRAA